MYRRLSQDDNDGSLPPGPVLTAASAQPGPAPPGFAWTNDADGGLTLTPIIAGQTQTVEEGASLVAPTPAPIISIVQPTPVSAPAVPAAGASALPASTVTPTQIAPGVYVNPAALVGGAQVVTSSSGALQVAAPGTPAVTPAPFNLTTWLAQSTGGVKNQTLAIGAGIFAAALLLISSKKKKR